MEERGGAHRVTQRRLGDAPVEPTEEIDAPSPPIEPRLSTVPRPDPPPVEPVIPRGASDIELRERQAAWRRERARFERFRRETDSEAPSGSSPP
jgi:hypothetical protein